MVSPENTNWIYDYGLIDDIAVPVGNLLTPACVSSWPMQAALNGSASNPWGRADPGSSTSSKACREKLRRDKLNDKFVELASILEPGRPLKTDKAAILVDAVRMRLKAEKEKLEQQVNSMNTQPSFMAPPPAAYPAAAGGQAMGNKLVPIISYPGMGMWQFMPPAAVDTSQDHMLHPPVA
ncbi:Myc-type, basic helix-loop-helix (bHLH) domain-containing protein [Cynara cardunculus var. scolymus]|uniref:Myc-type, basic helix-loop-helix (BHLH) domain-containing protein n=1 Tax=Cynara cardunculus var. scolymus TaxID=59895 RepID=A0A103XYB9_CYNCS|nr:Myc-type, basic helix-loop-helix (bHLH) domain-containing protein [Cynara cardunculus var. scolymus]